MSFSSPADLYHLLKRAWSPETVATPFDKANPCRNQCAVTALAVRHYFGGDIAKTSTTGGIHFYNRIDDTFWDLAADQFDEPIPYQNIESTEAEALEHSTPAQFSQLIHNIEEMR
jgi:hypothetical protein